MGSYWESYQYTGRSVEHMNPYRRTEWGAGFHVQRQVCKVSRFCCPCNERLLLGNTIFGGDGMGEGNREYLNFYIGISMVKTFSNVCIVPHNGMSLVQNAFRTFRWELDRGGAAYMITYTIGCESGGRKVPILWGKYGNQFFSVSLFYRFCRTFPSYGKLMGKPMYFPYDEVYYIMEI